MRGRMCERALVCIPQLDHLKRGGGETLSDEIETKWEKLVPTLSGVFVYSAIRGLAQVIERHR